MIQSVNNLDYLPPVLSPMDIRATTYEEWVRLINEIVQNSSYEVLLLDLGDGVDDLYHIMDLCRHIYMPVLKDAVSAAKIKQFENLMQMWDLTPVLSKIEQVKPPFHGCFANGEYYAEQLMWSELGDYVRTILRKRDTT